MAKTIYLPLLAASVCFSTICPLMHRPLDNQVAKAKYFTAKMKYKGEDIRATKDLFLVSLATHPDILPDLNMNGLILSVPCGGIPEFEFL